jgi:hypothetical protein
MSHDNICLASIKIEEERRFDVYMHTQASDKKILHTYAFTGLVG